MPLFVVGFLAAIALRSTGVLSDDVVGHVKTIEGIVLATAMVGLGAGVKIATLRRLGTAPLRVGALAWLLVSGVALAGAVLVA